MLKQKKYDLLHTHEEAGFFAANLSKKFRILHLYDMHSSLPQQLSNFKYSKSKILRTTFERLEAMTIKSAHAVITICPELHSYVDSHYPGKFNKLIENVADNSSVFMNMPKLHDLKEQYNLKQKKIILYSGTLEPYQGIDLLINASRLVIEKFPHVRFVIVGGRPGQVENCKQLARQLGVNENFIFTGQWPPQEIPQLLNLQMCWSLQGLRETIHH